MKTGLKEFIRYTSLNVLGMIGLSGYILADTYFISKGLGANGLAALNLAIPIYSFIHGTGLMLGMGGATKYAILKSHKEPGKSNQVFTNTLYLTAIFTAIFIFTGIFLSGKITSLFGANKTVFTMAKIYLEVVLLFSPAFLLNQVLICFIRNDGSPKLSMFAMLTGSLANIFLDYDSFRTNHQHMYFIMALYYKEKQIPAFQGEIFTCPGRKYLIHWPAFPYY